VQGQSVVRRQAHLLWLLLAVAGCAGLPGPIHEPVVRNPFPQLSRVAVAPFFNLSAEPSVDGRQFALAYFNELQSTPGFEVVPIGVVESALEAHALGLESAADARRLAQILGVDAVVVGAVTDYSPYYPPRVGLRVEWYAAHPAFHPIPPGYGLPLGTPEECEIPESLLYEVELASARAELDAQTPPLPALPPATLPPAHGEDGVRLLQAQAEPPPPAAAESIPPGEPLPAPLPDADLPVLRHTRTYNGHDTHLAEALRTYYAFREDERAGGWESYLQRSDDYIRFCCHLHIAEMLSARGGAGETRVVWQWPHGR
jgi:hypothetical protein